MKKARKQKKVCLTNGDSKQRWVNRYTKNKSKWSKTKQTVVFGLYPDIQKAYDLAQVEKHL
jgi:hypothetical protein